MTVSGEQVFASVTPEEFTEVVYFEPADYTVEIRVFILTLQAPLVIESNTIKTVIVYPVGSSAAVFELTEAVYPSEYDGVSTARVRFLNLASDPVDIRRQLARPSLLGGLAPNAISDFVEVFVCGLNVIRL